MSFVLSDILFKDYRWRVLNLLLLRPEQRGNQLLIMPIRNALL
jgi:hypothetical protein